MPSVWVPVLEYPESMEHPEVLGVFSTLDQALRVAHERAKSIRKENLDYHPDLEVITRNRGFDVDDDQTLWCIRISKLPS